MKIRKLQLKNIGVFDDEEIEFKECPAKDKAEIHILTGENGTGKSTILMALAYPFAKVSLKIGDGGLSFEKRIRRIYPRTVQEFIKLKFDNNGFYRSRIYLDDSFGSEELFEKPKIDTIDIDYSYTAFAFSGFRQIETETVQANYLPKDFNPLSQSLEFIKDYSKEGEITINQLVANNISNRALSKEDGSLEEAKKYETVINSIETFIKDVTDYEVKFVLKRSPNELKLRMHGEELDFDVLPDGLRSLISWIADLLGRIDLLKWQDDLPITEKNLILFLDEIEVHLHPAWQRKVLPIVQKLFKNAQIFVSTHSPFVVNSVDDAWVYELEVKDGKANVREVTLSNTAFSIQTVLREVFEVKERFGDGIKDRKDEKNAQQKLEDFLKQKKLMVQLNGNNKISKEDFLNLAKNLATQSAELQSIVFVELAKLSKETGEIYEI